ncbi:TPA: hypothetical protein ACX6SN_000783 [Photobacterium damselae]
MSVQQVLNLLESQNIEVKKDILCVELVPPITQEIFTNCMSDAGYTNPIRPFDNKYQIKTGARYWSRSKFLFTSDESLFEECDTQGTVPESLLYFDQKEHKFVEFNSELDLYNKLKIFVELRNLLTELADHTIPNEEVIFLIKNDDGGVKHKVSIALEYDSFVSAFSNKKVNLEESVKLLEKLQQKISLEDAQDKERRNCMRSAFDVLIQGLNEESEIFTYTLANIVKFHKTYTEHHNMFLSDFTINKVIQEINTKDLEYTGKINEITSSVQTKALAIPGAMVAITAIMKVDNLVSAVGVIIALLLTCLVIQESLDIYKDSFKHLSKQVKNVFSRYQVLSQKSEVRAEAKQTEKALGKLIEKGEGGLSYVSKIIWIVWFASLFFVVVKTNNATSSEPVKLTSASITATTGKKQPSQDTSNITTTVSESEPAQLGAPKSSIPRSDSNEVNKQ